MIWFAAMMMAAQATSGAGATAPPQSVPALTAQQKQELSTYNFKSAGAALSAKTNQPAKKPDFAHSDSSVASPADCRCWSFRAILPGWSIG